MTTSIALQTFVDDELLRAPLVLEVALQATIDALQRGPAMMGASERSVASDIIHRLGTHRPRVIDRYVASLREQVRVELSRQAASAGSSDARTTGSLALVDDDEVTIDVVISHTIEAIQSVAEHELRELMAYTSALVGDMDVGADHNPFRAETQAQALWAAAQALPLSRGHQIALMRHAAMPMAQALRKAYAAACARLDGEGLEPAAYRTLIPPAGPRTSRRLEQDVLVPMAPLMSLALHGDVGHAHAEARATPVSAQASASQVPPVPNGFDHRVTALVGKLFESMLADRGLAAELPAVLARMQAFVLKAALADPALLESPSQPMWRFIDLLAHLALVDEGSGGEARAKLLRFAGKLMDQLRDEPRHTAQLYAWAIERLERFAAKRLEARCALAEAHITTMHQLDDRLARSDAPLSTLHGALDVTQLDTVPSALMETPESHKPSAADNTLRWLANLRAGQWLRLFRQGGWVYSQMLWPGERGEIWLFADGGNDDSWAIRRRALLLLREEGLAHVATPRSLLSTAGARLLRQATSS